MYHPFKTNEHGRILFCVEYWFSANGDRCEGSHHLFAKDVPAAIAAATPEIDEFLRESRYARPFTIFGVTPVRKDA